MITFKEYLFEDSSLILEGGNVEIKGRKAEAIDLTVHDRDIMTDVIMKGLVELNNAFKKDTGLYIWKPSVLKDGKIFSGSTKHFFDNRLTNEDFVKTKKSVGDIDLMVDENLKERIKNYIKNAENEDFGKLKLIGHKLSGDQIISLWELEDPKMDIQIDLEFVSFQNDKPSKWSEFSHSSSWDDMEDGIKGVFHKLLMTSLLGHKKTDSILQLKTKQKEIKAGVHTLSIKGLRKKFEKIGEQDGKPVIKETKSKDYITNFYDILEKVFGQEPTEDDINKFWSYKGIIKLIKKYLTKDKRQKIFEDFIDRLFGPSAQGLYRDDPNRDLDEKMTAVNYAKNKLNVNLDDFNFEDTKKEFYKNYK